MKTQEYEVHNSKVVVRFGDILASESDVIVSPDDDHFSMKGGVSRAILDAGGDSIQAEAKQQIAKRELGDRIETAAGKLRFKRIYHVITRFDGKGRKVEAGDVKPTIERVVDHCIDALIRSAYASIAFPAIGTGYANFPPEEVAATFAGKLGELLSKSAKALRVELFILPAAVSDNLGFLKFFQAFENKTHWNARPVRDHAVAMIHGIRTEARWHFDVGGWLRAADPAINPVPIGYGYFDVFKFLLPLWWVRRRLIGDVADNLKVLAETRSTKKLSIIAHSFGTFLTTFALLRLANVRVHCLILCGSIVPGRFPWSKLNGRLQVIDGSQYPNAVVINDFGLKDIWPVFAHSVTCGYGSTGRLGFKNAMIVDRPHVLGHSDFFTKEFVDRYWVPALSRGECVRPPDPSRWSGWLTLAITSIQVKWLALIALVGWWWWKGFPGLH